MTADPGEMLRLGQEILAAQPFSRLLGAEMTAFGQGRAVLRLGIIPAHHQQFGMVHGGVLAYLADNALTFAGASELGPAVLTGGLTITYLRPATEGVLEARARVVETTRRQAVCSVDVVVLTDEGGETVCAVGQGTVIATRSAGDSR